MSSNVKIGSVQETFISSRKTRIERALNPDADTEDIIWQKVAFLGDLTAPSREHIEDEFDDRDSDTGTSLTVRGISENGGAFTVNWNPTEVTHQQLKSDFDNIINWRYRIIFPAVPEYAYEFVGRINTWSPGAPVQGNLTAECGVYVVPGSVQEYFLTAGIL